MLTPDRRDLDAIRGCRPGELPAEVVGGSDTESLTAVVETANEGPEAADG